MKIRIENIKASAAIRPEGYETDVMSKGKLSDDGKFLEISNEDYFALVTKYRPTDAKIIMPVAGQATSCCGGKNKEAHAMPPVSEQIRNAAQAAGRLAGAVFTGNSVRAEDDVINKRFEVCGACEFNTNNRCSKCGCFWKLKVQLSTEKCPEGKW